MTLSTKRRQIEEGNTGIKALKTSIGASCFDSWQEAIVVKRRNRVIVERTFGKARNRKMSMAFDGWYSAAQDRIRNRYLVNKIIGELINSQYVKAFTTWQKILCGQKLEEQGLKRILSPGK